MKQIKRVNRQFLFSIGLLLVIIGLLIAAVWYSYIYLENTTIQFTIFLGALLITIFLSSIFRARLDSLTNLSYLLKIRLNQSDPIPIKRVRSEDLLHMYLKNNDFKLYADDYAHFLYYRAQKDTIKKMLRGFILEIVVYIKPSQNEFYLDIVDEEIEKIRETLSDDKKRAEKILITQVRTVEELDEATKDQIKEIIFLRSQSGIISTINVGLHLDSDKAVMLYSDDYSPSMYYAHHVEQIKKMV